MEDLRCDRVDGHLAPLDELDILAELHARRRHLVSLAHLHHKQRLQLIEGELQLLARGKSAARVLAIHLRPHDHKETGVNERLGDDLIDGVATLIVAAHKAPDPGLLLLNARFELQRLRFRLVQPQREEDVVRLVAHTAI